MALSFPNSPTEGQIYTDTPSGNRWVWDSANTIWKSTSTFTQTITVSSTAPGTPVVGQLWWNQDYGRLLVYYSDGTSSQWVDASPSDYTSQLAYNQANAAFSKANTALQNTSGTFAGSLSLTGNIALGGIATSSIPFQTGCDSGGTALKIRGRPSTNDAAIRWYSNDGATQQGYVQFGGQAEFTVNGPNNFIISSNSTTRMFFNGTSGNIGIGTSSPSTRLHVSTGTTGGMAILQGSARTMYFEDSGDSARISTEGTGPFAIRAASSGGNHLAIDTSGRVTTPYQPGFSGRRTSSQSGGTFWTQDVVDFNIDNCWSGGAAAKFTCPVAGRYLVITRFMNNANYGVRLFKNGSFTGYQLAYEQSNPNWQGSFGSAIVQCSASDYLQIYLDAAVYGDATSYNHVCISLLG